MRICAKRGKLPSKALMILKDAAIAERKAALLSPNEAREVSDFQALPTEQKRTAVYQALLKLDHLIQAIPA